ncbi:hypothetical protein [Candidatus Nitrospira inopinata]|jgi:hypothetical protein|uniref:Uncharacterized protein n=1 Tax=Candidatus Nitrospira inopinata TaxID=1715989 RepID=A0A0S4KVB8_9BACT|nr:hypothetical protein [Candidatus Nitrospira inopinata]CUQ68037.1 protein of unknown function [Candidatus Nitrospira inopinata]
MDLGFTSRLHRFLDDNHFFLLAQPSIGLGMGYGGLAYADTLIPSALSVVAASFLYVGPADLVPTLHGHMGVPKGGNLR